MYLVGMPKYWGGKNFSLGQKQKTERERERERLNDGDNNGQDTHGARKHTTHGAHKHAWRMTAAMQQI